jgi:hypothetical protein
MFTLLSLFERLSKRGVKPKDSPKGFSRPAPGRRGRSLIQDKNRNKIPFLCKNIKFLDFIPKTFAIFAAYYKTID